MSTQFEMGWNDVVGCLKRATESTDVEKRQWCENQIAFANSEEPYETETQNHPDYRTGAVKACKLFLKYATIPDYRGPEWVVSHMRSLEPQ